MLTSGEIPASVAGEGRPDGTGAVAYLPSFVVAIHNQYVLPKFKLNEIELPHRGVKTSEVYLVKRRDEKETAVMKKISRIIRQQL